MQEACIQALGDIGGIEAINALTTLYTTTTSERIKASVADAASRLELFQIAKDVFPHFITAPTRGIRRQYAIALGNLLGPLDVFYQYISGSESRIASAIRKLFSRLETKLKHTTLQIVRPYPDKPSRVVAEQRVQQIHRIQEYIDTNQTLQALQEMYHCVTDLLVEIFGAQCNKPEFQEFAFRIDPHFGSFVWFLEEVHKYLETITPESNNENHSDIQLLMTLLLAFFLDNN
jgi:hypothetical protein